MNEIHPSAIIDTNARLGDGNVIGPFCYLGPTVRMGDGNVLVGWVAVGTPPEKEGWYDKPGPVEIGDGNRFSEFVTVHAATFGTTRVGHRCKMLRGSHLGHDAVLEDDVTVSCTVMIGGESHVMKGANLGLGAVVHQQQTIGAWAMVGMGAVVPKKLHVFPGGIYVGNPARYSRKNRIGLERASVSDESLREEETRYRRLRDVGDASTPVE